MIQKALNAVDQEYVVRLRRELHEYPELRFELPRTLALVRRELDAMGIPYTEEYGISAIVATINPQCKGFTIGLRADMDALPLNEKTDLPYASKIPGAMHACGHDAHTAMLLGTARALKTVEDQMTCRVRLIFQPYEEGCHGAKHLVNDGVMDDIDIIVGLHVENWLESGTVGVCIGPSMAGSAPITVEFFGHTAHATLPHSGNDTIAMAVTAYNEIHLMLNRQVDPFQKYVCSVCSLQAGTTHNVIADHAVMKLSLRTYDAQLDAFIEGRIQQICEDAAKRFGGTCTYSGGLSAFPLINDPVISRRVLDAAEKVIGKENVVDMRPKLSSEDFSWYLTKKPGVFFRLGTRNEAKGCVTLPHNNDFLIDEDAFSIGCKTCVQFVLDNMDGIEGVTK